MIKKAQARVERLLLSVIILIFGGIGIMLWSYGVAINNTFASWIGRILIALIALIVLIIERFLP